MTLKVYCFRMSQPSREITIDLTKREHKLPEYKEINPFGQVPSMIDGDLNHAILSYIACASPDVADHCPEAAAEAEKILTSSLSQIESVWLHENGNFLLGHTQPSIADLSLVCEIICHLHEKDRIRVLTPFKKVLKWIEDTRIATSPHFEEVHKALLGAKSALHQLPVEENYESMSSIKAMLT
ncbi:hypothetical protein MKX03_013375 [Papaver bracteatum]|nr:hypothetical protein MKX03_013375 [Papaver bracteatum]